MAEAAANVTDTIGQSATNARIVLGEAVTNVSDTVGQSAAAAQAVIGEAVTNVSDTIGQSVANARTVIGETATSASDLIARSAAITAETIGRSASEAERTLVGTSTEVSSNILGKADDFNTAAAGRLDEMARLLDEKSNGLLTALTGKGQEFASEVSRVTDHAVKSIETKSFVFTQTMMDNSEEIARLINDASQNATAAMTRTLGQLQEGADGITEGANATIARTLADLHSATKSAVEESKQTAAATVADMLETHSMLRTDSTALFERLREANILLQEVLSGAHENMNSIEHTMASRVSEFVSAMNELSNKSGATTTKVEQHLGTFNTVTAKVLQDLGELSTQFTTHGRSLAEAVQLLELSNRRTEEQVTARNANVEALVATLDARSRDFEQRLQRFSGLLQESLEAATTRTREIASLIAEASNNSVRSIEQQFDLVRAQSEEERKRTSALLNTVYEESSAEAQAMFDQTAERFTAIMQGMKQMAAEMQQELETTRTELRRGVFELPQETAESTAQMRRVIVDQIEALAELNRIVARHGRAVDTAEPVRREAEAAYATGGGRAQVRPIRPDMGPAMGSASGPPPAPPQAAPPASMRDITGAPARRPSAERAERAERPERGEPRPQGGAPAGNDRNAGWLSDLLTRASSRDEGTAPARGEDRAAPRDAVDSLDTLSVDIARMIDQEAAADLWERYRRGERSVFTRRLYTVQGQKAFDEIRAKYRSDPEFRQTVEHYIHEFERLLDDAARSDRGPAMVRSYLTSDTGKVYTMLAHAAGRFDQ